MVGLFTARFSNIAESMGSRKRGTLKRNVDRQTAERVTSKKVILYSQPG
jgi:hypothetical protein